MPPRRSAASADQRSWSPPPWKRQPGSSLRRLAEKLREVTHHAHERIRRGLPQVAEGGVAQRLRELVEQRAVPDWSLHEHARLLRADPAGRALAAAFVLEEAHQV